MKTSLHIKSALRSLVGVATFACLAVAGPASLSLAAEGRIDTAKAQTPKADLDPTKTSLDPKNIEGIMGLEGQMASGVYKITIGRTTTMHGHEVGNAMGINTWAAFVGTDQQAAVDGDFVMVESELQSVLKALRGADINVVAIHNHIETESPRIVFLHYWGVGSTTDLAKGLKSALDNQNK